MKRMTKTIALALFVCLAGVSIAFAQGTAGAPKPKKEKVVLVSGSQEYVEVNYDDLADTSILVGALTLEDQSVLDEYAQLFYCKIYQDFFENDSQWLEVSNAMRQKFQKDKATIPRKYFFKVDMMVGRYDTATKSFPLEPKSVFNRVSVLEFFNQKTADRCGLVRTAYFPTSYSVHLNTPLTIDRIVMTSQEMLQKVSEIPLYSGSAKKVTAVFFVDVQGYKERLLNHLFSKVIFSGNLEKIAFYTDDTLSERIRSVDFASIPSKPQPVPRVQDVPPKAKEEPKK